LVGAEYLFRFLIFSENSAFKELKDPGKYANIYTDDYWKLYYLFGGGHPPPKVPHPILGWKAYFNQDTYVHRDEELVKGRRKVLLYGDSFAQCIESVACFEDILNTDSVFSKNHYLLNYGVGGYGVDQIFLLCSLSLKLHENPFVVISILPNDMDRSILTVRTGQKPYFEMEKNELVLKGVPMNPVPADFYVQNPPGIKSYIYARAVNSDLNPNFDPIEMPADLKEKSLRLNEKIILELNEMLKNAGVDYVFMIFDNLYNEDGDWRYRHLMSFMHIHKLPYFGTGDLIANDAVNREFVFEDYIIDGNGHPTSYYNKLVADEIARFAFDYENKLNEKYNYYQSLLDTNSVNSIMRKIKLNKEWLADVKKKALERNIPIDSMIYLDAVWTFEELKKKN
jgi:hypothetical protein